MRAGVTVAFRGAEGNHLAADRYGKWPHRDHALLLHGGGQTRHAWGSAAMDLAAAGFAATCLDLRGHGESQWVETGAYSFPDFAADIARVVADLAAEAGSLPVLIGASLGGLSSMLALGEGLTEARALVLVDVTPKVDMSGVARIQGFMAERAEEGFASLEEAADVIARYLPHRPRPRSLDGLRKNLRLDPDGRWRWHWDPRFLHGPKTINHRRDTLEERMALAASRLTLPTLLVRGGASELVGEAEAEAFLALVPQARFVDVTDARHMVAGDANDAFSAAVVGFMRELAVEA